MEMKKSEIFDRYSILLMKANFCEKSKIELKEFEEEIIATIININATKAYKSIFLQKMFSSSLKLAQANAKIWEHEASIRKEFDNDPSSKEILTKEKIGEHTIMIRNFNKQRIEAKTEIDILFDEQIDIKIDHLSENK